MMKSDNRKRNTSNGSFIEMVLPKVPETLTEVLNDVNMKESFRQFLKARVAIESLLFFESIEMYKQYAKTAELRTKIGISMVNKFVREDSTYWVNIPHSVREPLLLLASKASSTHFNFHSHVCKIIPKSSGNVKKNVEICEQCFNENTFDRAEQEVLELMESNFFESFIKHLQYSSFMSSNSSNMGRRRDDSEANSDSLLMRPMSSEQLRKMENLNKISRSMSFEELSRINLSFDHSESPDSEDDAENKNKAKKRPTELGNKNKLPMTSSLFRKLKRVSKARHLTFWSDLKQLQEEQKFNDPDVDV